MMSRRSAPAPRRRTVLKLLAGSIASRLGGRGVRFAAAATLPVAVGDTVMSMEFDADLRSRILARQSQPLTDFEAGEALRLKDGTRMDRFAFLDQRSESVHDAHGPGTRHVLRGLAEAGIEKEIGVILYDRYPGFALTRVAYRNAGTASVAIAGWVNGAHVLKPLPGAAPEFWSFSGASHDDRRDWVQRRAKA